MRATSPDDICGLCDEFDVEQASPEAAAARMGLCHIRAEQAVLAVHVAWDGKTCVSFRLDRPNLKRRRQFVKVCQRAGANVDTAVPSESTGNIYEAS